MKQILSLTKYIVILGLCAQFSSAARDPAAYHRPDGFNSILYRGGDNNIWEMYRGFGGTWTAGNFGNLTTLSGLVSGHAVGNPAPYVTNDKSIAVVYRENDGNLVQATIPWGASGWTSDKLTAPLGAPFAVGDPAVYVRSDNTNAVVYRGSNGDLIELSFFADTQAHPAPNQWLRKDLSIQPKQGKAPSAAGDPAVFVRNFNLNSVVYRAGDGHVIELSSVDGTSWSWLDLTNNSGGAPLAVGDPVGYVRSDDTASVVYRGANGDIFELALTPNAAHWRFFNLSASCVNGHAPASTTDAHPAAYVRFDRSPSGLSTPFPPFFPISVNAIVYRGTDSHVYELNFIEGGTWHFKDLTTSPASGSAPIAAGAPAVYLSSDSKSAVVYRGYRGQIYELSLDLYAASWAWNNVTSAVGPTVW